MFGCTFDQEVLRRVEESLREWRCAVKVYAKGCDAPGCTQEAEVDGNLGRPIGWYFLSLDGGERSVKKTIVICQFCFKSTMLAQVMLMMPVVAP